MRLRLKRPLDVYTSKGISLDRWQLERRRGGIAGIESLADILYRWFEQIAVMQQKRASRNCY
jgi:hypothetical protein